ncbi:isopenicillin N synthase family oxygenase [Methylobacillus flagellatus]|uniref:isopenicillin N synthase family dioxygenase n=1 Tax=Methylobacillus flagellatus TaxID=405 RepID=UPI0028541A87|nr:2-oxoglutarate and iron-dependent oxygenase domain-containing protein [Methylobacillus flagellatus]MDR5171937.1 isopenicillin N synthase family oxygenase [Methylobacillus flagellatus]
MDDNHFTQLEIPVIDIAGLRKPGSPGMDEVVRQLGQACREVGFFYIKHHGIPQDLIRQTFAMAETFFSQPLEQKLECSMERHSKCFRGYSPVLSELADGKRNSYELMEFSVDFPPDAPEVLAKMPMHGPNIWPPIEGYRTVLTRYIEEMNKLGFDLMRGIALSLDLEENYFHKAFNGRSFWQFRTVNYPEATDVGRMTEKMPELEQRMRGIEIGDHNCGAHTDYGCLTILLANNPGLQVLGKNNAWFDAPVIEDAYICNIGDMLQYWSRDAYVATKHRVLTNIPRISLPFFFQPNYDSVIEPVQTVEGQAGKSYPPLQYGPYAYKNYKGIYPACPTYES